MVGDSVFVVKLATGFYNNPKQGLPSSNGLILILSAITGEPLALLQDEGFLTDSRTAAAGAIASKILARDNADRIGIIGTGIQARMQLIYHHDALSLEHSFVWGRDENASAQLASDKKIHGIDVTPMATVQSLCEASDIIVTTTPTTKPLVEANWVKPGTHVTAVGADAPGKQELDSHILKQSAFTAFDSRVQCLHHGEASHLADIFNDKNSAELGELLGDLQTYRRKPDDITIADLTGIAAQDIAAAKTIWAHFQE
jgi:ornithine cyclodeaminase